MRRTRSRLNIDTELSHLNRSKRSLHFREVYTDEMKAVVATAYHKDIELLGYEFDDLPDASLSGGVTSERMRSMMSVEP